MAIDVNSAMFSLPPGETRVVLNMNVVLAKLLEQHVVHHGYMLGQGSCVVIAPGHEDLADI